MESNWSLGIGVIGYLDYRLAILSCTELLPVGQQQDCISSREKLSNGGGEQHQRIRST